MAGRPGQAVPPWIASADLQPLRRTAPSATPGSSCCACPTTRNFKQVYQHDGTVFYGYRTRAALVHSGARARYVRLQLPGQSYFHLDEVEVYAVGDAANIGPGKPATQSSISPWSVAHGGRSAASSPTAVGRNLRTPRPRCSSAAAPGGELAAARASGRCRGARRCERSASVSSSLRQGRRRRPKRNGKLFRGPLGGAPAGLAQSAAGLRCDALRQARPGPFPAHVRPVLRLVVAAGRRGFRARGFQAPSSRSSAA